MTTTRSLIIVNAYARLGPLRLAAHAGVGVGERRGRVAEGEVRGGAVRQQGGVAGVDSQRVVVPVVVVVVVVVVVSVDSRVCVCCCCCCCCCCC